MRTISIPALLALLALLLWGCGGSFGGPTQPGTATLEFRLIAKTDAEGVKVPTWDGKSSMFVEKQAPLTDKDVEKVHLAKLPDGSPCIDLQLDQTASIALESITSKNIGRRLAILVHGKIVIAPTIKETITGGKMTLAGFSPAETQNLYSKLKK